MTLSNDEIAAIGNIRKLLLEVTSERRSIAQLIEISGLSESKLTKGFKETYGQSLYHFQLEVAMNQAKAMLDSGMMVKEVRIALGYSFASNFARAFYSVVGVNPAMYKMRK